MTPAELARASTRICAAGGLRCVQRRRARRKSRRADLEKAYGVADREHKTANTAGYPLQHRLDQQDLHEDRDRTARVAGRRSCPTHSARCCPTTRKPTTKRRPSISCSRTRAASPISSALPSTRHQGSASGPTPTTIGWSPRSRRCLRQARGAVLQRLLHRAGRDHREGVSACPTRTTSPRHVYTPAGMTTAGPTGNGAAIGYTRRSPGGEVPLRATRPSTAGRAARPVAGTPPCETCWSSMSAACGAPDRLDADRVVAAGRPGDAGSQRGRRSALPEARQGSTACSSPAGLDRGRPRQSRPARCRAAGRRHPRAAFTVTRPLPSRVLVIEDDPIVVETLTTYSSMPGSTSSRPAMAPMGWRARSRRTSRWSCSTGWCRHERTGDVPAAACRVAVPVLMLTARTSEDDRVRGFETGADDYVPKPFSPREVVARVQACCGAATAAPGVGNATADCGRRARDRPRPARGASRWHAGGADADRVPPARGAGAHPGRTFTREELVARAFGPDYDGLDRTVDTHVTNLRRKLDAGLRHR